VTTRKEEKRARHQKSPGTYIFLNKEKSNENTGCALAIIMAPDARTQGLVVPVLASRLEQVTCDSHEATALSLQAPPAPIIVNLRHLSAGLPDVNHGSKPVFAVCCDLGSFKS
jgi:hypothetical protein